MVTKLKAHSTMMVKSNTTDIKKIMEDFDWKKYVKRNKGYIESFDYIRDMAVEDPGDSPVITASYGGKFTILYNVIIKIILSNYQLFILSKYYMYGVHAKAIYSMGKSSFACVTNFMSKFDRY